MKNPKSADLTLAYGFLFLFSLPISPKMLKDVMFEVIYSGFESDFLLPIVSLKTKADTCPNVRQL